MRKTRAERALPRPCRIFFVFGAISLYVLIVALISPYFANVCNSVVCAPLRALLALISSPFPFSLAELALYLLLPLAVLFAVLATRRFGETWRDVLTFALVIASVLSLLFSVFVFTLGVAYRTEPLDERLELAPVAVDGETLTQTAERLVEEINALTDEVTYGEDGFSVMPYNLREMNDNILTAYTSVSREHPFVQHMRSRVKPVLASRLMCFTHITGVYSYYTGEANLNTYFPDYTLPFTAAHELAHQRGIARENEASFIAFLALNGAHDPYLRYAAKLNMLEYVTNALYVADSTAYRTVIEKLDARVIGELRAYAAFFDEFENSAAAGVSDTVNDTYLKLNGNEAGSESYGLVVELAVAYYCQ